MLKNILSLLLSKFYSKEESELVGHQAMPSTQNVALTPTTTSIDDWGAVYNGVAPTDGFACIRFTADTATCIASAQTQNVNVFTTPQVVGDILLCACPIAKGQVFTLCARQAKNIECWFTKTIGGVQSLKNALLQGGVLCRLSRLYSSLRRSSLLVRRSGSLNSVTRHPQTLSSFRFQTIITCILTLHQRTVCLCLGNLVRQELVTWKSSPLVRDLISISQALEFTKVLQCRLIEAKRFLSRQPQITEDIIRSFTSSRLSVKREVGLGGASC